MTIHVTPKERRLETIGFSLISAGIFREPRSLEQVLEIGATAIVESAYPELKEVHMVCPNQVRSEAPSKCASVHEFNLKRRRRPYVLLSNR